MLSRSRALTSLSAPMYPSTAKLANRCLPNTLSEMAFVLLVFDPHRWILGRLDVLKVRDRRRTPSAL